MRSKRRFIPFAEGLERKLALDGSNDTADVGDPPPPPPDDPPDPDPDPDPNPDPGEPPPDPEPVPPVGPDYPS